MTTALKCSLSATPIAFLPNPVRDLGALVLLLGRSRVFAATLCLREELGVTPVAHQFGELLRHVAIGGSAGRDPPDAGPRVLGLLRRGLG